MPLAASNSYYHLINVTKRSIFIQVAITSALILLDVAAGSAIAYAALNPFKSDYEEFYDAEKDEGRNFWVDNLQYVAIIFGAFTGGPIAEIWGRKPCLLFSVLPYFVGWLIYAFPQYVASIVASMLCGFAFGMHVPIVQIYVSEVIAPPLKSIVIAMPYAGLSWGILLTHVLGIFLEWRHVSWYLFSLPILLGVALLFVPESPIWLTSKHREERTLKALNFLMGYSETAKSVSNALWREQVVREQTHHGRSLIESCKLPEIYKPFVTLAILVVVQIMTGGSFQLVLLAARILEEMGIAIIEDFASISIATLFAFSCTVYCSMSSILPRRPSLMFASCNSGVLSFFLSLYLYVFQSSAPSLITISVCGTTLVLLMIFNGMIFVMQGILIGEMLPVKLRGPIASISFSMAYIILYPLMSIYPVLINSIGMARIFLIFGLSSVLLAVSMFLLQPETWRKSTVDMEANRQTNAVWYDQKE